MEFMSVGTRPRVYQRLMPLLSRWKTLLLPGCSLLPNSSTPHGCLLFPQLPDWLKLQKEISEKWHHDCLSHRTAYVMTTWSTSTGRKSCNLLSNSKRYLSFNCDTRIDVFTANVLSHYSIRTYRVECGEETRVASSSSWQADRPTGETNHGPNVSDCFLARNLFWQ